jgi:hypothetical protein
MTVRNAAPLRFVREESSERARVAVGERLRRRAEFFDHLDSMTPDPRLAITKDAWPRRGRT